MATVVTVEAVEAMAAHLPLKLARRDRMTIETIDLNNITIYRFGYFFNTWYFYQLATYRLTTFDL